MNATNLYVTTCRLVMQADPENRDSWTELYKLLPYLRQSLSCTVCGKLLAEPYTPTETSCQHHVCRKCIGGKKRLKPSCSWCKDYSMYVDNVQIKLVLQCYRKLCEYIKFTPIYCKLCSIYSNGGQFSLVDMINEAIESTAENNKCDETNNIHVPVEYESDDKDGIAVPHSTESGIHGTTVGMSLSPVRQQSWSIQTQTSPQAPPAPVVSVSAPVPASALVPASASPIPVAVPVPVPSVPAPAPPAPQASAPSTITLSVAQVSSLLQPVTTTTLASVSCQSGPSLSPTKPVIPTAPPIMQPTHHFPLQTVAATTTTITTTVGGTSGLTFPPGTIFPSTNVVKHSVVKEVPYPKHNSSVNNGSSMYSVLFAEGDSTKITIKRKPPESDNTNKSVAIEPETVPPGNQELIRKPKPKPKPKPKRKGCRCGNATATPGKLTCCGQRCPCYVEAKACIECRCRGCRNPHRPGGKKVRPVIPQLANIQIHQVQPVHGRTTSAAIPGTTTTTTCTTTIMPSPPTSSTVITNTTLPQTIRAMQAMHAVQAVHGVSNVQAVAGGVHQLISLSSGMVQAPLPSGLGVNPVASLSVKPVSLALTSVPAHLLINDDRSTSNSDPDNSDVDVDI